MHLEQLLKLKKSAHHLKPIVIIGQKGLTDAVTLEIDQALKAHELLKLKISGWEKNDREEMINSICNSLGAETIQIIGHVVTIYRKNND
jgi:RNA-binding protein